MHKENQEPYLLLHVRCVSHTRSHANKVTCTGFLPWLTQGVKIEIVVSSVSRNSYREGAGIKTRPAFIRDRRL